MRYPAKLRSMKKVLINLLGSRVELYNKFTDKSIIIRAWLVIPEPSITANANCEKRDAIFLAISVIWFFSIPVSIRNTDASCGDKHFVLISVHANPCPFITKQPVHF